MKNFNLKKALFEAGITQRGIAKKTGIPEAHISMAIHGRFVLDGAQKARIAKCLERDEKEIFPNVDTL